jgi:hypothetical protein
MGDYDKITKYQEQHCCELVWNLILLSFHLPHFSFHLSFPTKFPQALIFPWTMGLFFWRQGVVTLKAQLFMLLRMTRHYFIEGKLLMLLWMIRPCYTKGATIDSVVMTRFNCCNESITWNNRALLLWRCSS